MAMNQTRYFATAPAKNSAVTMAAGVSPSSTYSKTIMFSWYRLIRKKTAVDD